jgi:hypothetical protein
MKTAKKILIVILVLLAIPLIAALFVDKSFKAERDIVIEKPKEQVFNYLKYIKNQDNFGVWQLSDPTLKKTYDGVDGTVGFSYSWDGEKLGKGSQTIKQINEGERIETELNFGFGEPARAYFLTEALSPNQTKVTWGITGNSPYPFNLMSLFYDMGNDFDQGLANLKGVLEK